MGIRAIGEILIDYPFSIQFAGDTMQDTPTPFRRSPGIESQSTCPVNISPIALDRPMG
jgi:hypothetical protein